jgi:hypothetical protein
MSGFHEGELEVQQLAGVAQDAARLQGMLRPPLMDGGAAKFLAQRDFAAITARDQAGRLWISPLHGKPGFLEAKGSTLTVGATPSEGDPLHELPADQQVGLIVIEFAIRRRVRVNGYLTKASGVLGIEADQAYGNCPQYIDPDHKAPAADVAETIVTDGKLGDLHRELIHSADTFFLGTTHPERGADASHKGGIPGFVRLDGEDLWWPDYAGNNMFNSLGNIAVDPATALLFIDFATGTTLQLSGTATIDWNAPPDESGTGRRVLFHPLRSHLVVRA